VPLRLNGRRGYALYSLARILDRKQLVGKPSVGRNFLRKEITTGRIVLVKRMHAHAIDRRVASLGDRLAKCVMPFVANADPIESGQDDRFLIACLQDNAASRKWVVHSFSRRDEGVAQWRARRRRDIDLKRRNAKINSKCSQRKEDQPNQRERTPSAIRTPKSEIDSLSPPHFFPP
jgi:hypothetical protein